MSAVVRLQLNGHQPGAGDYHIFACQTCGIFEVTGTVLFGFLESPSESHRELLPYLRAETRQTYERGERYRVHSATWEQDARAHQSTIVATKRTRLLETLGRSSQTPGKWVPCMPRDTAPLLDAFDEDEVAYLLHALGASGAIESRRAALPSGETRDEYRLTPAGWDSLAPVTGAGRPGICFVAMSFNPRFNDVYDHGIRAAIEDDCGLQALRVDRKEHNEQITDQILAGIRSAQFVVADFTRQRQGVYSEAGFAKGLGREVIWTCDAREKNRVHFDTRQFNHILWTSIQDLRTRLANRIKAMPNLPVRLR